jgi:hypothetical protein
VGYPADADKASGWVRQQQRLAEGYLRIRIHKRRGSHLKGCVLVDQFQAALLGAAFLGIVQGNPLRGRF